MGNHDSMPKRPMSTITGIGRKAQKDENSARVAAARANSAFKEKTSELKQTQSEITANMLEEGVVKPEFYQAVNEIMCSYNNRLWEDLVEGMLNFSITNKDVVFLDAHGLKREALRILFYVCCAEDIDVFYTTLFMFKNGFFTIEEIFFNLNLSNPVSFYNPNINVEGLTAGDRSKLAKIPEEIKIKPIEELKAYVEDRFDKLKKKVKKDFNKRISPSIYTESDQERKLYRVPKTED